jgi:predicted RNA-binding Zn-ribbon protein involved in translation (DUF1610 family)
VPRVHEYHCDQCDFEMPSGWGGMMYVEAEVCPSCGAEVHRSKDHCFACGKPTEEIDADTYTRVTCRHPMEAETVRRVLGRAPPSEEKEDRTGFNSNCVCTECLAQFGLDVESDERECRDCGSDAVYAAEELVDEACPNCGTGTFWKEWTGEMS